MERGCVEDQPQRVGKFGCSERFTRCGWLCGHSRAPIHLQFVRCQRAMKAPEGWRSPGRFALSETPEPRASVLECGGPPPLLISYRGAQILFQPGEGGFKSVVVFPVGEIGGCDTCGLLAPDLRRYRIPDAS